MQVNSHQHDAHRLGRHDHRRWPRAAWLVLLLGIFLTAILTIQYERIASKSEWQHFEDTVDRRKAAIEGRLRTYITVLNAAAGMFEGSIEVTPQEFETFINRLELDTVYEGMDGIGFVKRVAPEDLDALVRRMHGYGYEDFAISPEDGLPAHFIITHIQPETEDNREVLGLELGRDEIRREAMHIAAETGIASATKALTVLPQLDPEEHPGFVIYVPVFDDDRVLEGFVFSSFRASALMAVVLGAIPEMSFEVYAGIVPDPDALLYRLSYRPDDQFYTLQTSRTINVAGQQWTVVFHAPAAFDLWRVMLPIVGILVTGLFSGIVWNLTRAWAEAADRAEVIRRQREWFEVTLASIGDAVLATDPRGRITFMNDRAEQLTGWSFEEALGRDADDVLQFVDEDTEDPVDSPVHTALATDSNTSIPRGTMLVRRNGQRVPVDDIGAPIRAADLRQHDSVIGAVVTFRDITERRTAENALRESQTRLQFALDSAEVGEWDYDLVTGQARRSLRHDQAFGYNDLDREWSMEIFLRHVHPDDRDAVFASFQQALEQNTDWFFQFRVIWPDGSVHWIEVHGSVYEQVAGKPTRMLGLVEDITERKQTEEQLRRSEERFRKLVTTTASIIWTANGNGAIVQEYPEWERFTGQTPQEYKGGGWIHAIHPDDRPGVEELWLDANQHRKPFQQRYRLRHRDGSYHRVEARGVPILDDESGEIREWVGTITDIEEKERVTEALIVSEQKFRWIIDSAVDFAIFTFDRDGKIDSWNPGAERVLGYAEEEILGKDVRIIFTEEDQRLGRPELERIEATEESGALDERWHVRAAGDVFYAAGRVMTLKDDKGDVQGFVKILHDRTAERKAQEELESNNARLQESESRFRTMADSAPVYIWMAGPDKQCIWFNMPWLEFTGRTMEQELGTRRFEFIHPDDRAECLQQYNEQFDARQPFKMKYRLRIESGEYRWLLDHGVPLTGSGNTFNGYIGSCIDITELEEARETLERHSSDLEQLVNERTEKLKESHQQLRLSERMASLGTLAAGIGHDLGNLLMPLRIRLDVLEPHIPEPERDNLSVIRSAAEYLGNLAKGLRNLATDPDQSDGWATTELRTWWRETEPLLRNGLPKHVQLQHDLPEDLPPVRVSPAALTQAMFNLVQNSGNALADQEEGVVRIWAESTDELLNGGPSITVGVSDDGPGMDEEVKRRCLEPFFTTKTREFSTGLGLSLVQGIVNRAGGRVEIDSRVGQGTTFSLVLPRATHDTEDVTQAKPMAVVTLGDARMKSFVGSELRGLGFEVHFPNEVSDVFSGGIQSSIGLWVVDAELLHEMSGEASQLLRRFSEENRGGLVVLFGEQTLRVQGLEQQVITAPGGFKPSTVREVLRRAASRGQSNESVNAPEGSD